MSQTQLVCLVLSLVTWFPHSEKIFSFADGHLQFHEDGLQLFEEARDLQVIAILGDGRAGKSHLGNAILLRDAFPTADGSAAMTEGIDVALEGNMLAMDCEGLNNALAPSRFQTSVIGAALASTLVFVVDGKLSEAGLNMLSGIIAEMQLLHKKMPTRLVLVVNKCTLDYEPQSLEKALESTHGLVGSRDSIKSAFLDRHFVTVPFDPSFTSENYRRKITELRKLLALPHGISFSGRQLSAMIRDLAIQQRDGFCDMPSLHQHIAQTYLESQVNLILQNFSDTIPEPVEYDPDYPGFNFEISEKLKEFDAMHLLDAEVALPFAQKLRMKLEVLAEERKRINNEFGNSIANWSDVLRRGCNLLASRKIGGRFVVERKQDLSPFLTSAEIIHLDPPVPLSVRWMWQHFHPDLNPSSHDFAVILRQGHVVAVRVAAPPLPTGILPPRGNARHKAALSVSLRSDAWVVVVSQERGETSVACAGELWDVGSSFPEDRNYQVQEDKRRSILMGLGLLWESRQIHSTAGGRVHSLREPWVWDGTARDQQSGLEKKSRHHKGKNGAKKAAEMELRKALQLQGIIWNFDVAWEK